MSKRRQIWGPAYQVLGPVEPGYLRTVGICQLRVGHVILEYEQRAAILPELRDHF